MMGLKPSFSDLSHGIGGLLEWSKLFGSSSWIRTCGCERMGGDVLINRECGRPYLAGSTHPFEKGEVLEPLALELKEKVRLS